MPLPKVIVFDLGKVLLDFDYSVAARRIATQGRLDGDPMRFFTTASELLVRYETGLITTADFFRAVCQATGFRGTLEEFADYFGDIFTEIGPMVALQSRLRAAGFPTYIFSNTNDLAVRHIRKRFPFFAHFDGYIFSYEHGAMKPGARLYEVVERQTGRAGADLLYIDDRLENVEAGAARGWQVILQESPGKTIATVAALGLAV